MFLLPVVLTILIIGYILSCQPKKGSEDWYLKIARDPEFKGSLDHMAEAYHTIVDKLNAELAKPAKEQNKWFIQLCTKKAAEIKTKLVLEVM